MFSLQKLKAAFFYSVAGLRAAFKTERAFRQEVCMAVLLVPIALIFGKTGLEKAMLIASVVLALVVELVNTAVETLVERISSERHELSGKAKDIGSAAVFLALLNVLFVWVLVFFG